MSDFVYDVYELQINHYMEVQGKKIPIEKIITMRQIDICPYEETMQKKTYIILNILEEVERLINDN